MGVFGLARDALRTARNKTPRTVNKIKEEAREIGLPWSAVRKYPAIADIADTNIQIPVESLGDKGRRHGFSGLDLGATSHAAKAAATILDAALSKLPQDDFKRWAVVASDEAEQSPHVIIISPGDAREKRLPFRAMAEEVNKLKRTLLARDNWRKMDEEPDGEAARVRNEAVTARYPQHAARLKDALIEAVLAHKGDNAGWEDKRTLKQAVRLESDGAITAPLEAIEQLRRQEYSLRNAEAAAR